MYNSAIYATSEPDGVGGQRNAPAALPPGERRGIHWTGRFVGFRAVLDWYGKSRPHRGSNPRRAS